jgi:hypothetical protein
LRFCRSFQKQKKKKELWTFADREVTFEKDFSSGSEIDFVI